MSKPSQKLVSIDKSICAQHMIGYSPVYMVYYIYGIWAFWSVFVFGCRYFYFSLNWLDFGIGNLYVIWLSTALRGNSHSSLNLRKRSQQMLWNFQFVLDKVQQFVLFSFLNSVGRTHKFNINSSRFHIVANDTFWPSLSLCCQSFRLELMKIPFIIFLFLPVIVSSFFCLVHCLFKLNSAIRRRGISFHFDSMHIALLYV